MAVAPGSASGGADAAAAASSFKWAVCPATGGQLSDADEATLAAVAGAWFDVDAPAGVLTLRGTVWTAPAFLALSTLVGRKLLVWPAGAGGRPRSKNDAKKQIKLQRRQLLAPREASTTRKRSQPDGQRACPAATGGAAAAAVATQRDVHPSYKTLRRARHQASDDLAVVAYFPPLASGGFRCGSGGSSGDGQGAPTHDQNTAGGQRQQQSFLLRVVSPYLFVYECAAKARWVGQELLPLLCTEFVMFPRAYFEAAIARGLLRLDGRPTRCSDVVRSGAILTHEVLCREPASWVAVASPRPPGTSSALPVRQSAPCRGGAISASSVPGDAEAALSDAGGAAGCNDVVMTADHLEVHTRHLATHGVLLVNKPPGVPVYPTGSFRQATVSKLLERALRRGEQPLARLLVRAAAAASLSSATVVTATAGASGRARGGACGERTGGSADTAPSSMGVLPSLHFVHRLDWLVSGLLIVAVGRASAQHVTEQLMLKTARATATGASGRAGGTRAGGRGSGQGQKAGATAPSSEPACLRKLYIACVRGKFPAEPTTCRLPIVKVCGVKSLYGVGTVDDNSEGAASGGADGKAGVGGSSSNIDRHGKPAETIFRRLRYAPTWDVSLVQCAPLTGRQHQIRVHLAALGFPILNDRPYGGVPTVPPAGGGGGALAAACRACHAAAPKWAAQKQSELLLQVGAALGPSEAAAAAAVREQFHADWVARTAPARAGAGDGAAANSGAAGGAAAAAAAKIRLTWGLLHACPATRNAKAHPEETGGGGGRAGGGGGPDNEAASPGSAGASRFILLHAQRYQRDGHWDFRIPPPPWVSFIFPDYSSTRRELGAAPTKK